MKVSLTRFLEFATQDADRRHGVRCAVVRRGGEAPDEKRLPGAATLFCDERFSVHPSLLGPGNRPLILASTEPDLARRVADALASRGRRGDFVAEPLPADRLHADVPAASLWSADPYLARRAAEWPQGRVLDLGCGSGRDAVHLAQLGHTVTAIDRLPDALELGRQRAALVGVEVHWRLADVRELSAEDLTGVDHLIAVRLQSPSLVLELARQLPPGASLLLRGLVGGGPKSPDRRFDRSDLTDFQPPQWQLLDGPRRTEGGELEWIELEAQRR